VHTRCCSLVLVVLGGADAGRCGCCWLSAAAPAGTAGSVGVAALPLPRALVLLLVASAAAAAAAAAVPEGDGSCCCCSGGGLDQARGLSCTLRLMPLNWPPCAQQQQWRSGGERCATR
jgi:hypothetical protein